MIKVNMMVAAGALLLVAVLLSFSAAKQPAWHRGNLAPANSVLVEPWNSDSPADATVDPDVYPLLGP